jgi:DNA-binding transcriptional regulator YdaS (Cro superfamily)
MSQDTGSRTRREYASKTGILGRALPFRHSLTADLETPSRSATPWPVNPSRLIVAFTRSAQVALISGVTSHFRLVIRGTLYTDPEVLDSGPDVHYKRTMHPIQRFVADNATRSQAKLARQLGCQRQHISEVIAGRCNLSLKLAKELVRVTGGEISLADIANWEPEEARE